MHHTKEKGDLASLKIAAKLSEQGLKVLVPLSEHMPFDLVAFDPSRNTFYKVQCKYRKEKLGKIEIKLKSCYSTSKGVVSKRYDSGSFDVLAVYVPERDLVFFCTEALTSTLQDSIVFRTEPPKPSGKGGLLNNSRMVEDYLEFPKPSLIE